MRKAFGWGSGQKGEQPSGSVFVFVWFVFSVSHSLSAPASATDLDTLIQSSCIACHDANTETRLDFTKLEKDLEKAESFRQWVRVFDRIERGEMPPPEAEQPSKAARAKALSFLENELKRVNRLSQQAIGRAPSRRLSRLEYEHTLHDLLGIGGDIARFLPPENKSDTFDVVTAVILRVKTGQFFAG